jgi:hypothetical protein
MSRRAAPALYELMRRPGSPSGGTPDVGGPSPRRSGNAPGLPAKFEVSLGRAAIIGAFVVVAIAIAYGVGVQRGGSLARGGASNAASDAPESPRTAAGGSSSSASNASNSAGGSPAIPALGGKSDGTAARKPAGTERAATDNNGDPRVKGDRYFVLAHPSSERASEMVDFCRLNGLDAYLVPDDNALLRKIIVLPGYRDASEKSSPEIKNLEAKIRSVGDKWKRASRGNKDFGDAYPELFR